MSEPIVVPSIFNRASQSWRRLVEPFARVQDADHRREARFLASLLLALMIVALLAALMPDSFASTVPGRLTHSVPFVTILVLSGFYLFARMGFCRQVSIALIVYCALLFFATAIINNQLQLLYYLVATVILSSIFLSIPITLVVDVAQLASVFFVARYVINENSTMGWMGPVFFNGAIPVLIFAAAYHRNRMLEERQKQQRESELRYRILSELISDYAYSLRVEPDGTPVHEWLTDDSYTRVTGYTREEIDARGKLALYHPDEHARVEAEVQRTIGGEPTGGEYRIITRSGEPRWLYLRRLPEWDADHQRVVRIYGVAQDVTGRKQSEEALRVSEERYRIVSELISDYAYSYVVTSDGKYMHDWTTESFTRITGYTAEELGNTTMLYHPDDEPLAAQHVAQTIAGKATRGEYRIYTKSGELRWLQLYRRPVWDEHEQRVVRFYGIAQDITERKRAEQALRESQQRLSLLVQQTPLAIVEWDLDFRVKEWNPAAERTFGYTAEEALGKHAIELIVAGEARTRVAEVLTRLKRTLQVVTSTNENITKDGRTIICEWCNLPLIDEHGKMIGYAATAQDVTERKRAEEALRASEERYRIISELISDYAYSNYVEPDGTVRGDWSTDDSFLRVTGYTWKEMDARGQITLYHPEDRARVDADIDRMLQGESLNGEYRIITKSGEQRWVHIYRRPVWDENQQRVSRYYGVAQDITERKQSEAQRFKLTLERERLALVNRLVQAVSHDFRTSMANIETSRYLIQRLLPGELREELLPKLNTIQERVMHLNRQLDNLRMVSSLANPQTEPCNLNGIVESVLTGYRLNDQFRKLQIKTELDPQLPAIIGDKGELKHVLQQLVANALNHTPEGGTITLRTFGNAADVILRVEDTGSGIAPQHLPHIFELFYRADPARSVESGGVGLGLSIVKMIVEAHGGTVSVESTVGKGTTFSIALHSQATPQPST